MPESSFEDDIQLWFWYDHLNFTFLLCDCCIRGEILGNGISLYWLLKWENRYSSMIILNVLIFGILGYVVQGIEMINLGMSVWRNKTMYLKF